MCTLEVDTMGYLFQVNVHKVALKAKPKLLSCYRRVLRRMGKIHRFESATESLRFILT